MVVRKRRGMWGGNFALEEEEEEERWRRGGGGGEVEARALHKHCVRAARVRRFPKPSTLDPKP